MNITNAIDLRYAMSGFGVGMLVGMTGVGGGSLMTPLLILIFGVHPATAVGTDLLYAGATKTFGSLVHGLARTSTGRSSGGWRWAVRRAPLPPWLCSLASTSLAQRF